MTKKGACGDTRSLFSDDLELLSPFTCNAIITKQAMHNHYLYLEISVAQEFPDNPFTLQMIIIPSEGIVFLFISHFTFADHDKAH